MPYQMKTKPPKKFSTLLQWSLDDVLALERDERFKIDMSFWAEEIKDSKGGKVCHLCMAGAVLMRRSTAWSEFKQGKFQRSSPSEFHPEWERALRLIDVARDGRWSALISNLLFYKVKIYRRDELKAELERELPQGFPYVSFDGDQRKKFPGLVCKAIEIFKKYERKKA